MFNNTVHLLLLVMSILCSSIIFILIYSLIIRIYLLAVGIMEVGYNYNGTSDDNFSNHQHLLLFFIGN